MIRATCTPFVFLGLAVPLYASVNVVATEPLVASAAPAQVKWDARAAEHLLNRAAFGGTTADVERFVRMGQDAAIESLFPDPNVVPAPEILAQRALHGGLESPEERHNTVEERRDGFSRLQPDLIVPLNRYGDWWIERMIKSDDPLRDRMTIFWHGHFCSSVKEVASSQDMINQVQFLRGHALGRFEALVRGIGRDPAMLRYLNNDTNVKDHPNENWARELMELFSLGDGNYTETDIKQAARAFTGWSRDTTGSGTFEYKRTDHDFGDKRVLSVDGNLDGDHVIDIVLEQPACGRFLARKILAYLEGVPPSAERIDDYADFLRKNNYDIGKMLRRLFKDPQFYRDEVLGTRVTAPIEYLVGAARRLAIDPPGQMVLNAGDVLGQRLFWPPSVKGWEEGMAWITTATMMQRSNMIGVMLGLVDVRELLHDEQFSGDAATMRGKPERTSRTNGFNQLRYIQQMGWEPKLSLVDRARKAGKTTDDQIADWMVNELIAIPIPPELPIKARECLKQERMNAGEDAELALRKLAHFVLSQPEAQVN